MKDILWLIQYISNKNNINSPEIAYSEYLYEQTHVSFYHYYILNHVIYNESQKQILENCYFKSKKIINALKKFFYIIKIKKAINSNIEHDLYFNELSTYPEKQKLQLYISKENTLYNFRISNLISLWLDSLKKNDGLFVKPVELRNPYTNVEFKPHNLYNIYFAIKNSTFNMNPLILAFFKCNFQLSLFIYKHFPILKEFAISSFIKHGSISELYEEIHNMLTEFETDIDYLTLPDTISYRRKTHFVNELIICLRYYLIHAFSCNPLLKRDARKSCKEKLLEYVKNNDLSSFIRRRPPEEPLLPPQIFTNNYIPVSLTDSFNTPVPQINEPPMELENNDIEVESIESDSDNELLQQLLQRTNPFEPTATLPRTPPNNNPNNNPNNIDNNQGPFQLRLFR